MPDDFGDLVAVDMPVPQYFESHITIDPVFDERLERFKYLGRVYDFRVADLVMLKPSGDSRPSDRDAFCTGRSPTYGELHRRMMHFVGTLKDEGFRLRRYKIEAVVFDERP